MKIKILLISAMITAACFVVTGCCSHKDTVARVVSLKGLVTMKSPDATDFSTPAVDQQLYGGTSIRTQDRSGVELAIVADVGSIEIGQNTYLELRPFSEKELRQTNGIAIYRINKQGKELRIQTPHGMASVLGTVFRIDITASATQVCVKEGRVGFAKPSGDQIIIDGGSKYSTASSNNNVESLGFDTLNRIFVEPVEFSLFLPDGQGSGAAVKTPANATPSTRIEGNNSPALILIPDDNTDPAWQVSSPDANVEPTGPSPRDQLEHLTIEHPKED